MLKSYIVVSAFSRIETKGGDEMKNLEVNARLNKQNEGSAMVTMAVPVVWCAVYIILQFAVMLHSVVAHVLLTFWMLVAIGVMYFVVIRAVRFHGAGVRSKYSEYAFYAAIGWFVMALYHGIASAVASATLDEGRSTSAVGIFMAWIPALITVCAVFFYFNEKDKKDKYDRN